MIQENWIQEIFPEENNDPGKDIFSLMFFVYLILTAICMIYINTSGDSSVNVNSSGDGSGKVIEMSLLAEINSINGQMVIIQGSSKYRIPEDIDKFCNEGKFDIETDEKGNKNRTLIIKDPETNLSGSNLLKVVRVFNEKNVGVDFRPIVKY